MRDIKTKEHNGSPKVRSSIARMPKELIRTEAIRAKERSGQLAHATDAQAGQESPTEYGSEKLSSAEEWMAGKAADTASLTGRRLAKKSYEKLRTDRRRQGTEETVREVTEEAARESEQGADVFRQGKAGEKTGDKAAIPMEKRIRDTGVLPEETARIKVKPESKGTVRAADRGRIKTAPKVVKSSSVPENKVKTVTVQAQKRQAVRNLQTMRRAAVQSAQNAKTAAKTTQRTAKVSVRGVKAAVQGMAAAIKSLGALLASGGGLIVFLIIVVGIVGGILFSSNSQSAEPLSEEVLSYTATIQRYANEYGISEYVPSIQAIMMQESGGRGTDPMQSSECPYNTRYPNSPNAITEPEYSIQVGIQYYASCVTEAGCENPYDMDKLKLSWQGYNYGNGYISWALRNYGGYSEANALQFSQEQAASHGWARYGDPEYVPHVLRYYSGGTNIFAGLFGNTQIVTIAKNQLGNAGGQKFWSWYGFSQREEWCACFVSWCADQSGLIASGSVPKFAYCPTGVDWFKSKGKWKDGNHTPSAGTIIFFDWGGDGTSDHVGIVERCEDGIVYTVEGNSGDAVRQRSYPVRSSSIMGYGLINDF